MKIFEKYFRRWPLVACVSYFVGWALAHAVSKGLAVAGTAMGFSK